MARADIGFLPARGARAERMRIMIVTDAWFPQTNGVVQNIEQRRAMNAEAAPCTTNSFRHLAYHPGDGPGVTIEEFLVAVGCKVD